MSYKTTDSRAKVILKKLIPDPVLRKITGLFYGWHGNYKSWQEASLGCTGYDSQLILEKVSLSAQVVRDGKAAFERDSVIYNQTQFNYPVLSALLLAAAEKHCGLNVLDYGGSLGSTYYQNKAILGLLPQLNWCIVEEEHYVNEGKKNFADTRLHFYHNVDECLNSFSIDAALFSSVLQYLENPYSVIKKFTDMGVRYIIIDRTPFVITKSRITVQKVHPAIYKASYPCWFFNEAEFISRFTDKYSLIAEFRSHDVANIRSEFKGFIFRLNGPAGNSGKPEN